MPKRTDIRNALKTVCEGITGISTGSVLIGRERSIPPRMMPAICIYTENEEKQLAHAGSPRAFDRAMDVIFEIHVQENTVALVEEQLDLFCDRLESAVLADETLGGLVRESIPVLDEYEADEGGKRPGGVAECRYSVTYTD